MESNARLDIGIPMKLSISSTSAKSTLRWAGQKSKQRTRRIFPMRPERVFKGFNASITEYETTDMFPRSVRGRKASPIVQNMVFVRLTRNGGIYGCAHWLSESSTATKLNVAWSRGGESKAYCEAVYSLRPRRNPDGSLFFATFRCWRSFNNARCEKF